MARSSASSESTTLTAVSCEVAEALRSINAILVIGITMRGLAKATTRESFSSRSAEADSVAPESIRRRAARSVRAEAIMHDPRMSIMAAPTTSSLRRCDPSGNMISYPTIAMASAEAARAVLKPPTILRSMAENCKARPTSCAASSLPAVPMRIMAKAIAAIFHPERRVWRLIIMPTPIRK